MTNEKILQLIVNETYAHSDSSGDDTIYHQIDERIKSPVISPHVFWLQQITEMKTSNFLNDLITIFPNFDLYNGDLLS